MRRRLKQRMKKDQAVNPREVLNKFFIDRAWEVLNAAKAQYPQAASHIEKVLVKLITEGKIRSKITGEELYGLFLRLGLRVRLQTRIQVLEHGKVKSLEEKKKTFIVSFSNYISILHEFFLPVKLIPVNVCQVSRQKAIVDG